MAISGWVTGEIMKKTVFLVLLFAQALLFSGCGGKDIVRHDAAQVNDANNFYARERFTQATEVYRTFVEENPDSQFRGKALIGLADSLYKDRQYFEAALYYERFLELYPLDALTPRALFYLGMCSYHDSRTSDRDQTQTHKAIQFFTEFLEKYPDHSLASYAKNMVSTLNSVRTGSMMEIARFYYRINKNQSAIQRLDEYLAEYPDSEEAPEAMFLLGDCYYREQSFKRAAGVFTRLIKKYPENKYATRAMSISDRMKIN